MFRWTEFRAKRRGGDPVQEIVDTTTNATDGGGGRIEGGGIFRKTAETGGAGGLELNV